MPATFSSHRPSSGGARREARCQGPLAQDRPSTRPWILIPRRRQPLLVGEPADVEPRVPQGHRAPADV
jgi:hypothetical protein